MAEYNGVRIEPLSDGGQDLNYQVEQFISGAQAVLPYWLCLQNSAMLHYAQMQHTW